jgi:hypothetical protein
MKISFDFFWMAICLSLSGKGKQIALMESHPGESKGLYNQTSPSLRYYRWVG